MVAVSDVRMADKGAEPALLPRVPLAAFALTAVLVPTWLGVQTSLLGGLGGLAAVVAVMFLLPPVLAVQTLVQLVLRARSRTRPTSTRAALAWTLGPVVLLLACWAAWDLHEARFQFEPEVVSAEVRQGDLVAQVVRREWRVADLDDGPYGAGWSLQVTDGQGVVREAALSSRDGIPREFRGVRYEVSVKEPGWSFDFLRREQDGRTERGVVYLFRDGLRARESEQFTLVDGSEGLPGLDDDLRERLARLPLPAEEWANLRVLRLDGDPTHTQDLVCEREDVLLVISPEVTNAGQLLSKGPILVTGRTWRSNVASARWIFFDDDSRPFGAEPVLAEQVFMTGDHGFSDDFTRPPTRVPPRPSSRAR
jgi:hypothetical protein